MTEEELKLKVEDLASQLDGLAIALACEREINRQQAAELKHSVRKSARLPESLTVGVVGMLVSIMVLVQGLRVDLGWASFALPADILQTSGLVGVGTTIVGFWLDKKREQDEGADTNS